MDECSQRGIAGTASYPGNLQVRRRARGMVRAARTRRTRTAIPRSPKIGSTSSPWPSTRKTPSGGRIVTAPTNGAAGIIPAVLHYAENYTPAGRADSDGVDGAVSADRRCHRITVQTTGLHLRRRSRVPRRSGLGCLDGRRRARRNPRRHTVNRWKTRRRSQWSTISA